LRLVTHEGISRDSKGVARIRLTYTESSEGLSSKPIVSIMREPPFNPSLVDFIRQMARLSHNEVRLVNTESDERRSQHVVEIRCDTSFDHAVHTFIQQVARMVEQHA